MYIYNWKLYFTKCSFWTSNFNVKKGSKHAITFQISLKCKIFKSVYYLVQYFCILEFQNLELYNKSVIKMGSEIYNIFEI